MEEYIRYSNEERSKVKLKGLIPLQARAQALSQIFNFSLIFEAHYNSQQNFILLKNIKQKNFKKIKKYVDFNIEFVYYIEVGERDS